MWSKLMLVMTEMTGLADVGGVQAAAEAHFQHGDIDLPVLEMEQCCGRRDFEIGRALVVALPASLVIHVQHGPLEA